jgi:uncharacterized SAM-binding protein YcdF (DUF218 family)
MPKITRRDFLKIIGAAGITWAVASATNLSFEYLLRTYQRRDQCMECDTITVFGAGAADDKPTERSRQRADAAIPLFYEKAGKRILLTGGVAPGQTKSEARVMANYILNKGGISSSDLVLEEQSKTTVSNLYFSKVNYYEPEKWKNNVLLTDGPHGPRVEYLANKILGPDYVSKLYTFSLRENQNLSQNEINDYMSHEKKSMALSKFGLLFVNNGDHETVRKRFERVEFF